uniref:RNA-directed RNA polymerase n=1 Tax=Kamu toti-like virus 1 TaxID=2838392 RepID=A0A8E6Z6J8_9VIRU|nr:hypothetical protein [Kamu toti-like virus 1]
MYNIMRLFSLSEGVCMCQLKRMCKKNTACGKLGGKYICSEWEWLCYWENLFGYVEYVGSAGMYNEGFKWLGKTLELGGPMGERRYMEELETETLKFMSEEWINPIATLDVESWVKKGNWMRGKSGTGRTTFVKIEGKDVRTRRMKGVDASFMSDAAMAKNLKTVTPDEFHIMEKSEGGKIRPVVKTGSECFRKMDYLSQWMEDGFNKCRLSTLFGDAIQQEDIDMEIMESVRQPGLWKVPMDQSNFDQHQSKRSLMTVMGAMGAWIWEQTSSEDFKIVWTCLWDSLFYEDVKVLCGEKSFKWRNGMPSGFRWTALLDTILNIVSFRVALNHCKDILGYTPRIYCHKAQGDDVAFAMEKLSEVATVMSIYNDLGYEAHPLKTFYSRDRTEFLRRCYSRQGGINGYVTRSLLSTMYRNPIQEPPIIRAERLYSRLTAWQLSVVRGCDGVKCGECFLSDAEQLGVSRKHAAGFALTPASWGGAGLDKDSGIGKTLAKYFSANYVPVFETEELRVIPRVGQWADRLNRFGNILEGRHFAGFYRLLARSWGITERDITGEVKISWQEIKPYSIRPRMLAEPVTKPDSVWDLDDVATILRPFVKDAALQKQHWRKYIKPEYHGWMEGYLRRVSKGVSTAYLTGQLKMPWPIIDRVSMRYGARIRLKYDRILRSIVNIKDIGLEKLSAYCAFFEEKLIHDLKEKYSTYVFAQ